MTTDFVGEAIRLMQDARTKDGREGQVLAFKAVEAANNAIDQAPDLASLLAIGADSQLRQFDSRIPLRAFMEAIARAEVAGDRDALHRIADAARAQGFNEAADLAEAAKPLASADFVQEAVRLLAESKDATDNREGQMLVFRAVEAANQAIDVAPSLEALLAIAATPQLQELERRIPLRAYMEAVARSEQAHDREALGKIAQLSRSAGFEEAAQLAESSLSTF